MFHGEGRCPAGGEREAGRRGGREGTGGCAASERPERQRSAGGGVTMGFRYEEEMKALRVVLAQSGVRVDFGPASADDLAYLREVGAPPSVIQFYEVAEPAEGIDIADARLWPIADLRAGNEDAIPGYVIAPMGYPVIGTTLYGDIYCLALSEASPDGEPPVLLASHDEIEEGAAPEEVRRHMVRVADSFPDFLRRFVKAALPISYYDVTVDGDGTD
jgi:hypothetical protein